MKTLVVAVALVFAIAAGGDSVASGRRSAAGTAASARDAKATPPPPQLPEDFRWTGRYVVPDLDVEVPFTWYGSGGDIQMTAGGEGDPVHFTNIIHDGVLYTLTYEFPDIPRHPCSNLGAFTLEDLNHGLETSRFVGAEILQDARPRKVNHFRAGVVWEPGPDVIAPIPGIPIRIPIMVGDIYVDRADPTKFWKVLQFGLQNLYDPELDEWIVIDKVRNAPGEVVLPDECTTTAAPATTAASAGDG